MSDYNKSEEISIYPSLTRLFMFPFFFLCSGNYKFDYLVISTISQMHTHTRQGAEHVVLRLARVSAHL